MQTGQGRFRVDMLVAAERVVVAADGMVKYALAADDGSKGNALTREKRLEESLSRAGFVVVRLTWDDVVNHPAESAQRVRHALAAAVRR